MHAKPSIRHKTKEPLGLRRAQAWEPDAAVFALLGLVAMVAIVLAAVSASLPARPSQLAAAPEDSSVAQDPGSGQLIADTRTTVSGK
jgi:hypothetical protein